MRGSSTQSWQETHTGEHRIFCLRGFSFSGKPGKPMLVACYYSCLLPFSKIMPKTLHRSKSKIWSSTHFFFSSFVCLYTNKYNILCRFYVILFGHFYIKKYNSVPLYFISCFNFDILLNFDAIK